ncbi:16S rRNA (guanine(527)-N(7))-methyltransferase RsmG [Amphibiibacter pelophylacis]|uniref:16S rRNA (guanine(527)-N(7))-methyltransferase RsmG n=1 Tax=Amphibiibacter pelophylacis TaxID=1799477 RepID=UPI003BFA7175
MAPDSGIADRIQAQAQQCGVSLPDGAAPRLAHYLALLQQWNRVYNLTAVEGLDASLTLHLADCLAVLPALADLHARITPCAGTGQALEQLDVGSGGGLPVIVFALALPQVNFTCVDTVQKKCAFLEQAALQLKLANLRVVHARVEQMRPGQRGRPTQFDVVSARAFAALDKLVRLSQPLLAPGGWWFAMKGQPPHDEIATLAASGLLAAQAQPHIQGVTVPGLDAQRCIVTVPHLPNTRPKP